MNRDSKKYPFVKECACGRSWWESEEQYNACVASHARETDSEAAHIPSETSRPETKETLADKQRIFKEGEEIWTDGTNSVCLTEDVKECFARVKERIADNLIRIKQRPTAVTDVGDIFLIIDEESGFS